VLKQNRTSMAKDKTRTFTEGTVGRVCRVSESGSGICWVQFGARCLRIHEKFLEQTNQNAPACSADCEHGRA
jgi:hypothetical protein